MKQTITQLKEMKEAIERDDEESILLMVEKLSLSDHPPIIQSIIKKSRQKVYRSALDDINDFIDAYSGESLLEDQELKKLREELDGAEKELQDILEVRDEHLRTIDEFNNLYSLKLGDLIRKVLSLKRGVPYRQVIDKVREFKQIKEIYAESQEEYRAIKSQKEELEKKLDETDEFDDLYDEIYENLLKIRERLSTSEKNLQEIRSKVKILKDTIKSDPAHKEYQESTREYEEFKEEEEELSGDEKFDITEEERERLKRLFRQAAKLCHPDIVSAEYRDQAQYITQELNGAYKRRDLKSVEEIYYSLENNMKFERDDKNSNDKEIIKFKLLNRREKIKEALLDIDAIKQDETYSTIDGIDDWESYFEEMQDILKGEYKALKSELLQGV